MKGTPLGDGPPKRGRIIAGIEERIINHQREGNMACEPAGVLEPVGGHGYKTGRSQEFLDLSGGRLRSTARRTGMGASGAAGGAIEVLRPGCEPPRPRILDQSSETWFFKSPPVRSGERPPSYGVWK